MSALDCMGLGVPVVAPGDHGAYAEFIPSDLRFPTEDQGVAITRRLLQDDEYWRASSDGCRADARAFTPERTARRFLRSVD